MRLSCFGARVYILGHSIDKCMSESDENITMDWVAGESGSANLRLPDETRNIMERMAEQYETLTQSRFLGLVALYYLQDRPSERIEGELEDRIEDLGGTIPGEVAVDHCPEPLPHKEWSELDTERQEYSMPQYVVDLLDDVVGQNTKSRWFVSAIRLYDRSVCRSRRERVAFKNDYLRLLKSKDTEPESRIMSIVKDREGDIYPDVYESVWGGDEDLRYIERLSEVDWSEQPMDHHIAIQPDQISDETLDYSELKHLTEVRARATMSIINGMSQGTGQVYTFTIANYINEYNNMSDGSNQKISKTVLDHAHDRDDISLDETYDAYRLSVTVGDEIKRFANYTPRLDRNVAEIKKQYIEHMGYDQYLDLDEDNKSIRFDPDLRVDDIDRVSRELGSLVDGFRDYIGK